MCSVLRLSRSANGGLCFTNNIPAGVPVVFNIIRYRYEDYPDGSPNPLNTPPPRNYYGDNYDPVEKYDR